MYLKYNCFNKNKNKAVFSTCRSKVYDSNNTKVKGRKWKFTVMIVICGMVYSHLRFNSDKLKLCTIHAKTTTNIEIYIC